MATASAAQTSSPIDEPQQPAPSLGEEAHASIREAEAVLAIGRVTFPMAMKARYLQWERWNSDAESRAAWKRLYPRLCAAFVEQEGLRESLYADEFAAGVALTADCQLYAAIWWDDFDFDTGPARALEAEISDLRMRAQLYLPEKHRKICMQRLLRLYNGLVSTLRREWRRPTDPELAGCVTDAHLADLEQLREEFRVAQAAFRAAGAAQGQRRYVSGVMAGAVAIILAAGAAAALVGEVPHTIWLGALAAGAIGGLLSVLERQTRNKLAVQFQTDHLELSGIYRPVVGALSGLALYVLVDAGFLPFDLADGATERGLTFAGLGLIAGFSERLLKDVMGNADKSVGATLTGAAKPEPPADAAEGAAASAAPAPAPRPVTA